jgi:spectinomycin phosphotransferase
MRDPLNLPDSIIPDLLQEQYGLQVIEFAFLPQGGDINAAVYRVITQGDCRYFLKLLRGAFDETLVIVPRFLADLDIQQVIAPVMTIAEWGEKILFTGEGGKERTRALHGLNRWFSPNDVVEMAYRLKLACHLI